MKIVTNSADFTDNYGPKTVQNPSFHKKKLSQAGVDNFFANLV